MKKGYRLSAPVALYHYRQDKMANFAPQWATNAWQGVQNAGQNAWNGVQAVPGNINNTAMNIGKTVVGAPAGALNSAANNVAQLGGKNGFQGSGMGQGWVRDRLKQASLASNKLAGGMGNSRYLRGAIGYGALGAGALGVGALGMAGYNALRGNQEQQ